MKSIMKALSVLLLLSLVLAGCGAPKGDGGKSSGSAQQQVQQKPQPKEKEPKPQPQPALVSTRVYFPDEAGLKLVPVAKNVKKENKYREAVEVLIQGTRAKGMTGVFPKGVQLNAVSVKNGVATVDFSPELVKKFNGGSTGELMLVGSIVQTLTEFPEVQKVQLTIGGKKTESISGHLDISEPFVRNDKQLEL